MTRSRVPELATVAKVLAEPSRADMVLALMDGRAWTVGELARQADVARSTASEHVDRLVDAGLATEARQGRHRYLRIAGPQVAETIEALGSITPTRPAAQSLRAQQADAELIAGRTCYHHLAGRLGVQITDNWIGNGIISDEWTLTRNGREWFTGLGIAIPQAARRPLLRPCLDWTERRPHAAGVLADALVTSGLDRGWFVRGRHPRAIALSSLGAIRLSSVVSRGSDRRLIPDSGTLKLCSKVHT